MSETAEHTPGPWSTLLASLVEVAREDPALQATVGWGVLTVAQEAGYATLKDLFVAVRAHDELLESLHKIRKAGKRYLFMDTPVVDALEQLQATCRQIDKIAEAAIAKAMKGEQS